MHFDRKTFESKRGCDEKCTRLLTRKYIATDTIDEDEIRRDAMSFSTYDEPMVWSKSNLSGRAFCRAA